MSETASKVRNVAVITTGIGGGHPEHLYGTRKPALWRIFTSKQWVENMGWGRGPPVPAHP